MNNIKHDHIDCTRDALNAITTQLHASINDPNLLRDRARKISDSREHAISNKLKELPYSLYVKRNARLLYNDLKGNKEMNRK